MNANVRTDGSQQSLPFAVVKMLFSYRVHVYLLTFALALLPVRSLLHTHPESIWMALCFTSEIIYLFLLNKVTDSVEDTVNERGEAVANSQKSFLIACAFVFLLLPLAFIWHYPLLLPAYAVEAVLGTIYSVHFRFGTTAFRLKNILIVKNATSAVLGVLPPLAIISVEVPGANAGLVTSFILAAFCILFAIECLWDIRDIEGDRAAGVRTIPVVFGTNVARIISASFLLAYFVAAYPIGIPPWILLGWLISFGFTYFATPDRSAFFYHSMVLTWAVAIGAAVLFN